MTVRGAAKNPLPRPSAVSIDTTPGNELLTTSSSAVAAVPSADRVAGMISVGTADSENAIGPGSFAIGDDWLPGMGLAP